MDSLHSLLWRHDLPIFSNVKVGQKGQGDLPVSKSEIRPAIPFPLDYPFRFKKYESQVRSYIGDFRISSLFDNSADFPGCPHSNVHIFVGTTMVSLLAEHGDLFDNPGCFGMSVFPGPAIDAT